MCNGARRPEIIAAEGRRTEMRVLGREEYLTTLTTKLAEEVEEYIHE